MVLYGEAHVQKFRRKGREFVALIWKDKIQQLILHPKINILLSQVS